MNTKSLKEIIKRGRISGIGNKELTPELAAKIGGALGSYLGPKGILVVGREYSNNTRMLKRSFIGGVMSAGVNVLNLHSAPIPVLQFCVRRFGANGGAYFSTVASGNLLNVIRFFDSSGIEYDLSQLESIDEYFKGDNIKRAKPLDIGSISDIPHTQDIYKKAIPQFVNKQIIGTKNIHIVVDCSYGPSAITFPSILTELKSVDVIAINAYQNDLKSLEMFPNLRSIKDVIAIVQASKADLGVIMDTDGSRALYVDETGRVLSFEELMMFFLKYESSIANVDNAAIISTKSSSRVLDAFVAEGNKFQLVKTKNYPGEISRALRENRAAFGGSDTMKFYFPQYGPFSDVTFTTLRIIEIMVGENLPLSTLMRAFPRTVHAYKSIPTSEEKAYPFKENLRILLQTHTMENTDYQDTLLGMKLLVENLGWVAINPNLNANAIELEAEGLDPHKSEELIEQAEKLITSLI
jgi:mannose-1-phosphate guanylyltransferase/phosphomannomutase